MIRIVFLAAVLSGAATTAFAQVGTMPNPADPTPAFPIATDGSPLPPSYSAGSRFAPLARQGALSTFTGEFAKPTRTR